MAETTPMDVTGTTPTVTRPPPPPVVVQPPAKRTISDIHGAEVPDPKRNRADPNLEEKRNCIKLILHWHEYLIGIFKGDLRNIDDMADLTSMLTTIHTKLRQEVNGVGGVHNRVTDTFQFEAGEFKKEWRVIKPRVVAIAALYGIKYGPTESEKAKIGTLSSLLALFGSYRPRFNEVRLGTTYITLKKQNNETKVTPISSFGLSQEHSILTTGCTFNPTIQSAMKMSLGPMTIAINLAMQTERIYQEAWKKAFIQTYKLLPFAAELANMIAGSKDENSTLLGLLANISLFSITRASNKMTIPVAMLMNVARDNTAYAELFRGECPNTKIPDTALHPAIANMDMSGKGAFILWNTAAEFSYKMRASQAMTAQTASEMIFHATWGTAKENLELIGWMTEHVFQTRRQIGDQLKNRDRVIAVDLIRWVKVSKLASASQTSFLTGGKSQNARAPVVSSEYFQRVQLEGDLLKMMEEEKNDYAERQGSRARIIASLVSIKNNIVNKVKKDGGIAFGTTGTFYYDEEDGYGQKVTEMPALSEKFFYGQD